MILKIGHRGLKSSGEENTLFSIKYAIFNNFHAVELDIRKTKDNKIVLFHDPYIAIKDTKIRIDSVYHSLISDKVQTLVYILENIKINSISIVLDIKKCNDDQYFLYNLLNIIQIFINKGWDKSKFYFQSFHAPYIEIISHFDNLIVNYGIIYEGLPLTTFSDIKKLKCTYICINYESINQKDIENIKKNNKLKIFIYTLNNKNLLKKFKNADGIITDTAHLFVEN